MEDRKENMEEVGLVSLTILGIMSYLVFKIALVVSIPIFKETQEQ